MEVLHRFDVNRKVIAPSIDVVLEAGLGVFNHQMSVEHCVGTQRTSKASDDGRAKGQIGHEVSVHHVEVKPIEPCFHGLLAIGGQVREVGGEDAGCNDHVIPRSVPTVAD